MNIPPCNSCGGELHGPIASEQATAEIGEVWFDCSNCDQKIGIAPSGRSWQIILPVLWPSQMHPKMQHEAAEQNGGEKVFFSSLMVLAGFRTEAEHEVFVAKVADAVEEYKTEHPLPKTIRERLKGSPRILEGEEGGLRRPLQPWKGGRTS